MKDLTSDCMRWVFGDGDLDGSSGLRVETAERSSRIGVISYRNRLIGI
jgi:hypothetical protein